MSSFFNLRKVKKVLHIGGSGQEAKKKRFYNNIKININPEDVWEIVSELGDGAFGKVYKALHREKKVFAAAKICKLEGENDLNDFMVMPKMPISSLLSSVVLMLFLFFPLTG